MNNEAHKGTKIKMRNCSEEMLEEMYKNINMVKEAILNALSKVKDFDLSSELTSQLREYCSFSEKISVFLERCGTDARSGIFSKITSKISTELNTLVDSTDQHIAQLMIENTTICITDIIRLVRDYENSNCSECTLSLARSIVSYQEDAVEKLKSHL